MVKVRRLKKSYWANLGNDGLPLYENNLNFSLNTITEENEINTTSTNLIEDDNNILNISNSKIKKLDKNQDPSIINKLGFINTIHPRTQHDSESLWKNCFM